ncbi:hypothetical protein ILUMI_12269 [Ignelater luminosus]|uniref:Odorant-binding protein n=1 Tax=Ignelater luminosus TaxID=2038154 RepID=A0A8K0CUF7_IGNLU|nr:hypothetical protein ILUMI_12269 [Ignelater luminosus]
MNICNSAPVILVNINNMKFCILLLLLLVAYGSSEQTNVTMSYIRNLSKGPMAPYVTECLCQSHLNPQILEEYYKHGTLSDDACWKCYIKCILFKLDILSSTGDVNVQRWVDIFEYFERPLAEKCSNYEEPDLCQKAYLMVNCAYEGLSEQYSP